MSTSTHFQLWADKGFFTDWKRKPERVEWVRALTVQFCRRIPADKYWSTTELITTMLPDINQKALNYLVSGLHFMRSNKMLDGCMRYGPANARTFGRPSIQWINPDVTCEGLGDML